MYFFFRYFTATQAGSIILDKAKLFYNLSDLMGKFDIVIGTSAMARVAPKQASHLRSHVYKLCDLPWSNILNNNKENDKDNTNSSPSILLVLGRESSGLTSRELDMCDILITIPNTKISGKKPQSLNLAQACACILYEFFRSQVVDKAMDIECM